MHTLIAGVTETGKTTLAHAFAHALADAKQNVVVYDPVGTQTIKGTWPESAIMFSDENEFFGYLSRDDVYNSHIFVDEAGQVFGLDKKYNYWLLTRGRHFGFSVFVICQRPKMVSPTIRNQCARAYIFRLASDDLKAVGADFGFSDLDKNELDTGDFLILNSGQARYLRANIFNLLKEKPNDALS